QAMLQLAKRLKIDAVCASCNDFAALSAAYVAEHLNLPGHDSFEVAKIIHHKDLYRRFASANNIRSPFAAGFVDEASAVASLPQFSFPLMIKPVDLTGGKGITKVFSEQQAIQAIERAFRLSRERRVVVEEFVEGSRHGITTFVRDGKV